VTAIGMAPAAFGVDMSTIKMPTVLFAGQTDTTVTPSFVMGAYGAIPANVERAYVEIAGDGHGFPAGGGGGGSGAFARTMMIWMKVFIDKDARYTQFLCPSLSNANNISNYQASCPLVPPAGPAAPRTTRASQTAKATASASASVSASPASSGPSMLSDSTSAIPSMANADLAGDGAALVSGVGLVWLVGAGVLLVVGATAVMLMRRRRWR
jgi:hypothetical protein